MKFDIRDSFESIQKRIESIEQMSDEAAIYLEDMLIELDKKLREAEYKQKVELRSVALNYCFLAQDNRAVPADEKNKASKMITDLLASASPTMQIFEEPYDWASNYRKDQRKGHFHIDISRNEANSDSEICHNLDTTDERILGIKDNLNTIQTRIVSLLEHIKYKMQKQDEIKAEIFAYINKSSNLLLATSVSFTDEEAKKKAYERYLTLIGQANYRDPFSERVEEVQPQPQTYAGMTPEDAKHAFDSQSFVDETTEFGTSGHHM